MTLIVACGGEETGRGNQGAESTDAAAAAVPSVRTITLPELQRLIQDRNGKHLVLNMWATWCVPCKEEFPDLSSLAENAGETADVVGISLDYPDEIDSRVIPFLRQNPVSFTIYVADVANQDNFINSLNQNWSGALPTTFIYDSDGQQTAMLVGKRTLTDFENALAQTSADNSESFNRESQR
ncbi:TlpA family protein disulfide reductase [bacterium]|nr:TlpA family protein disulfide reductase [bacterium]